VASHELGGVRVGCRAGHRGADALPGPPAVRRNLYEREVEPRRKVVACLEGEPRAGGRDLHLSDDAAVESAATAGVEGGVAGVVAGGRVALPLDRSDRERLRGVERDRADLRRLEECAVALA